MNNTNFPEILKCYFQTNKFESVDKDNKEIEKLFNKSPAVREAFISWGENHSVVIQCSPRLYQAFNTAKSSSTEWKEAARAVNALYEGHISDRTMSLINDILSLYHNGKDAKPSYIVPPDYIERLMDLFESGVLRLDEFVPLLQIRDNFGLIPPLSYEEKLPLLIPLFMQMDSKHLKELFSIQERIEGSTLLHYSGTAKNLPGVLEKMDIDHLKELFLIKDKKGSTPLHDPTFFRLCIQVLEKMHPTQLIEPFLSQNKAGKTPLNVDVQCFEAVLPLLTKWDDENLNLLFSAQDPQGNTLLHNPVLFDKAKSLFDRLKPEVFEIQNHLGNTPEEETIISISWLVKDKAEGPSDSLSEREYVEKAQLLKQTVDEFWKSFIFGEEIPEEYLTVRIGTTNRQFSSDEVKEKIDEMVHKIINKTSWLGTPPQHEKEKLHQFYGQMLLNFEKLINALKNKDLITRAGCLVSLAKPVLEGRCAAAYQSEIEQVKMLQESNQATGDAIFSKKAEYCLINEIESVVRKKYGGSSHFFSQMLFLAGMASTPDPLAHIGIQEFQKIILTEWTVEKVVSSFRESFNASDAEYLEAWFCETTPANYGEELLSRQEKIKGKEQEVVNEIKEALKDKGIQEEVTESVLQIFQSSQGGGLKLYVPQRRLIAQEVFERLGHARTPEDMEAAQELQNAEREPDRLKMVSLQKKADEIKKITPEVRTQQEQEQMVAINKEKAQLQMKIVEMKREFEMLKSLAKNKIELSRLLHNEKTPLSDEHFDFIVAEKRDFDKRISTLAEEESIDFAAKEAGLPSRALERTRRQTYAAQFFNASTETDVTLPKLNVKGSMRILASLGVIEKPLAL